MSHVLGSTERTCEVDLLPEVAESENMATTSLLIGTLQGYPSASTSTDAFLRCGMHTDFL